MQLKNKSYRNFGIFFRLPLDSGVAAAQNLFEFAKFLFKNVEDAEERIARFEVGSLLNLLDHLCQNAEEPPNCAAGQSQEPLFHREFDHAAKNN